MSFWSWLTNSTPNVATDDYTPGDPDGVETIGDDTFSRSLPSLMPSPWSGWPAEWATPRWDSASSMNRLIDTAWAAIDLNASVLSAMPVYRLANGKILPPLQWMTNPDPMIYSSWQEFAKQLFWDYHLGEAFVLPMARYASGAPQTFRVVPPWLVNVELTGRGRSYTLGGEDVTDAILHIRYQSTTTDARGHGPLECAGARLTAAGLLQRYAHRLAETGGVPQYWIDVERRLDKKEATDLLETWVETRTQNAGYPAILSGGAGLNQMQSMNARDMALLELSQFNESRIAILLGVPPFLVGLPAGSGGDGSMTYSNVSQLFDFHDRASLRPKATAVMGALSGWVVPRGQTIELNRDEYSRPGLKERADAYNVLHGIVDADGTTALSAAEVRAMERLHGEPSAVQLSGGDPGAQSNNDMIVQQPQQQPATSGEGNTQNA